MALIAAGRDTGPIKYMNNTTYDIDGPEHADPDPVARANELLNEILLNLARDSTTGPSHPWFDDRWPFLTRGGREPLGPEPKPHPMRMDYEKALRRWVGLPAEVSPDELQAAIEELYG